MLRFHNTLSGRVEEFQPMIPGEVGFYYCGPTVWNYGHIGNFRSAVAADIIRRYLKFKGFKVNHVMNITDVDDRIIQQAALANQSLDDYTAKYIGEDQLPAGKIARAISDTSETLSLGCASIATAR